MTIQPSLDMALQGRTIEAVVIGASAGGVNALLEILPLQSTNYPCPIVVVLHVLKDRQNQLAEVFRQRMRMTVLEAGDKDELLPATLYFAPPGYHLLVEMERHLSLSCDPPIFFARPAIDATMESAADAYGDALLGILLTGANMDGAEGLAAIGRAGGLTVVQDPAQAQVPVMPEQAIRTRAPDLVLPLEDIRSLLLMLETKR
jgi:two-component system chemotaxis response regulator CheB